jgi:hypothetical protein
MNPIGVVAALATFLSVWFGHVAVRRIEFISHTIWVPSVVLTTLAFVVAFFSLLTDSRSLSVALGILTITLLIDALEIRRQQHRVKKGHAPANPNNPRHARILAEYSSATTLDLLKRDPNEHSVPAEQASTIL